ncbi:MAG: TonB-dependent receptor [Sphingomonadales bacterium]|nr:TonB-dependent receptor [Sphingomonadales bacterium]
MSRVACGVLATAVMSGSVWAQSAEDEAESDEIIVTATRSAEPLSKVPISVSTFSNEEMQKQGIRQFQDIVRFTPGLQLNESAFGGNDVSIRGIRSNAGAATTGIYIDDVPIQQRELGSTGAVFPAVFDLERVEVLRGPQGTLFGSGSQGGTIRFIRAQPSLTDYTGYARAEGAISPHHEGSYELGAAVGGPLIKDKLGFRVSAIHRRDGGWIDKMTGTYALNPAAGASTGALKGASLIFTPGQVTDADYNWKETTALSGALKFAATETLTITPSVFYQKEKNGGVNTAFWQAASNPGNHQFVLPDFSPAPADGRKFAATTIADTESGAAKLIMASVNAEWDAGFATVYSTTSYLKQTRHQYYDYTNGYQTAYMGDIAPIAGAKAPSLSAAEQESFIQEVRLQSNSDGPLKWVVGGFYQHNKQHSSLAIEVNTWKYSQNFFGIPVSDAVNPFGPGYLYSEAMWGAPILGESLVYDGDDWATERQLAGFAQADLKLSEQLTITAGVRYGRNWLDYTQSLRGPENNSNAPFGAPCTTGPTCAFNAGGEWAPSYPGGSVRNVENTFTPKVGVNFQMDDRNLLYASVSKGYRPGGGQMSLPGACNSDLIIMGYVDGQGRAQTPLTYGSDTVWAYEVGSKNRRLFGGAVNFSGSAFIIKWKEIQTALSVPTCGYSFVDNLSSATVKGVDFEIDVKPVEQLTLSVSGGYTEMKLDDQLVAPNGGIVLAKGVPVAGSGPKWRIVTSADFQQPISDEIDLYARTDVTYQGATPRSGIQVPGVINYDALLPPPAAFTLVNARIGVRYNGVDVSLFANNLLDNTTLLTESHGRRRPMWTGTGARPRQIGVTAAYRF